MAIQFYIIFSLMALVHLVTSSSDEEKCDCKDVQIIRGSFPQGFVFGAASSAYQYEGGYKANGKGESMWDHFTHTYPERIEGHSNGDLAVDSYHRYKEDVRILKEMNLDAYRFSISWSRLLPSGKISGGANQDGIDYYNHIINELLANGIEPFVTIFHFDIPQALEDEYGGFLSDKIVDDFRDFAEILFYHFGDRVKHWITMNEPWTFSVCGYATGYFAPGRCSAWQGSNCTGGDSGTEPYIVTHNQLLAHAAVVNLYRTKYQLSRQGKIGITLVSTWPVPFSDKIEDKSSAQRALDFMLGWFMDPLTFGHYPKIMQDLVGNRLPNFTPEQVEMVTGSFDFLGLNYYTTYYAANAPNSTSSSYLTDSQVTNSGVRNGIPIGKQAGSTAKDWIYVYPKGIRDLLAYIHQIYKDPLIYITENGIYDVNNAKSSKLEALVDNMRKDYHHDHLCCVHEAIMGYNAKVRGYFVWSLLDNFEWSWGYTKRFGFNYIDYNNNLFTRYPKLSAFWFKSILVKQDQEPQTSV